MNAIFKNIRRNFVYSFVCVLLQLFLLEIVCSDQPGQPTNSDISGFGESFTPAGGYKRTVEILRMQRAANQFGFNLAPGRNLAVSGTRSIPVVCVEFANRTHHFDAADYQNLLFASDADDPATPRPTLTQYYRDISIGKFSPNGRVFGWYKLPNADSFYEGTNNGANNNFGELLKFAFEKADDGTDFGDFDNDGPDGIPNSGDDDGIVDTIFIVHPETGGECGNGNTNIWSHSFQYSKFNIASGRPFETKDDSFDENGDPKLNADGSSKKIQLEDYTVQPGIRCAQSAGPPQIIEIGVFCHEYGHALGLPDLYDRTPKTADSEGVGHYCLMAAGSYGFDSTRAQTPVHMSAWCKAMLGWADIVKVEADNEIILEPVQIRNRVYNLDVPGTSGKEFFLLEFRDANWTGLGHINWDKDFNPSGLAIWHVDESVGESFDTWPFAPQDMGQNDAPSRPGSQLPGFKNPHALVTLLQRDNQLDLEGRNNRGDNGDLFLTGHQFTDDPNCKCGSRGYDGQPTGIQLIDIDLIAKVAKVKFATAPASPLAAPIVPTPSSSNLSNALTSAPQIPELDELFQSIKQKLDNDGLSGLSQQNKTELSAIAPDVLRSELPNDWSPSVVTVAADERTFILGATTQETTPVQEAVQGWMKKNEINDDVQLRVNPARTGIEKLTGIRTAALGETAFADAQIRKDEIAGLVGNVELRLIAEVSGEPLRYEQIVRVDDQEIPLHCNGVTLYYDGPNLKAIDSNVIANADIAIEGQSDFLPDDEAKKIVSEKLSIPQSRIASYVRRCIHFENKTSGKGRVVMQVNVKVGNERREIEVLVDNKTKKIVAIE